MVSTKQKFATSNVSNNNKSQPPPTTGGATTWRWGMTGAAAALALLQKRQQHLGEGGTAHPRLQQGSDAATVAALVLPQHQEDIAALALAKADRPLLEAATATAAAKAIGKRPRHRGRNRRPPAATAPRNHRAHL